MSITRHHNEWLSLVPNSGPFLSLPVLAQAFPQGLDAHDAEHARRLRLAFDEWDDNQVGQRPDAGLHRAWVRFVLGETLGYDDLLAEGQEIPQTLKSDVAEYGETLRPDWIVNDPTTKKVRLIVQAYPRSQSLTKPVATSRWKTSPDTRMMQLLHDTGIRLGVVTNGDHWMLVNAPKHETTGYASWYANLWLEEPVTLRAFRTLLSADRFFSVPDTETLDLKNGLLDQSQKDQQEVTDQLGYQVRKAVEVLIQALDKADQDHGRKLLADVEEKVLYESALTVMMRLVFLFCAEERELLLLGDELYDKNYAVSTLREQLRVTADEFGEEILGLRYDAWTRLLTTFRAVYAGAKHDRLKLPAYGGSLFNPDRFPFLEGRKPGATWRTAEATPLPVSNRTVLHLLEALQVLQTRVGKTTEARRLSFRSLDIEQIGHVYEGLLDHTAKRATEAVLGLAGTRDKEPEIALSDVEKIAAKGERELLKFLKEETGRSESALKKGLNAELDDQLASRFRTACQDSDLWTRVKRFAGLVRLDTVGYPVVITTGSIFVTTGTDRRSSGTHYTPKSLTEPIVQYTLEPLVYDGPAEGVPKGQWKLRPARELLDLKICDMACGSGAFLVQACRYMATRLLEAWDAVQRANPGSVRITPEGQPSTGEPGEILIPDDPDECQTYALRIVAQRCLYGVDKNPLAAEMAKLSLWLLTLAKDKPFEFLDHAIRCGDSLVGLHEIGQLKEYSLASVIGDAGLFPGPFADTVSEAIDLRLKLKEIPNATINEIERQERLLDEANKKLAKWRLAADLLVAAELWSESAKDKQARLRDAFKVSTRYLESDDVEEFESVAVRECRSQSTFHWPLEFPEVIVKSGGFDVVIGNPPFAEGAVASDHLKSYFRSCYAVLTAACKKNGKSSGGVKLNLASLFIERGTQVTGPSGFVALMAPKPLLRNERYLRVRTFLLGGHELMAVVNLPVDAFRSASVETCVLLTRKCSMPRDDYSFKLIDHSSRPRSSGFLDIGTILADNLRTIRIDSSSSSIDILEKLRSTCTPLSTYFEVKGGINPGRKDFRPYLLGRKESDFFVPLAFPGPQKPLPHALALPERYDATVHRPTLNGRDFDSLSPASLDGLLVRYRRDMAAQQDFYVPTTSWSAILGNPSYYDRDCKILIRQTASTLITTLDTNCTFPLNTVHVLFPCNNLVELDCAALVGILSSTLMRAVYRTLTEETGRIFPQVHISALKKLPIPKRIDGGVRDRLSQLVMRLYRSEVSPEMIRELDEQVFELYEITELEKRALLSSSDTESRRNEGTS